MTNVGYGHGTTRFRFDLKNLSIRQLQLYAAVCLWSYCNVRGISHVAIDELVCHLVRLSTIENLPDWEQCGSTLEITGRGDPLPESFLAVIPHVDRRSISQLIECCVEVGIVDMYGDATDQPVKFVGQCLAILKKSRVDEPPIEPVAKSASHY